MKYAIDRYITGKEIEVAATSFDAKSDIPDRKTRFFCPECCEQVHWRDGSGSRSSHFYHEKKTETAPECEKRVDGTSGLNLYERVGLPLYLSNHGGSFQLSIAFPALGSKLLEQSAQKMLKVIINGGRHERSVPINPQNFLDSESTLIPIDFLPLNNANFSIEFNTQSVSQDIKRRWADYADGFHHLGAVFIASEVNSKKIRRGGNISVGKKYLIVTDQFLKNFPEIKQEQKGNIRLNNSIYKIYEIKIEVSSKNEQRFSCISSYFQAYFNVYLLETAPELITLWPPCLQRDVLVPITKDKIYCSVASGNDKPQVYSYKGSDVNSYQINYYNERPTIEIISELTNSILSVDRKYIGNEITISRRCFNLPDFRYQYAFIRRDLSSIDVSSLSFNDLASAYSMNSNAKLELYIGSKSYTFLHIPIRAVNTKIPIRNNSCCVFIIIDGLIYEQFTVKHIGHSSDIDEIKFVYDLFASAKGTIVPVPVWVIHIYKKCRQFEYFEVAEAILNLIIAGKIHIGALKYLQVHQKDIIARN